MKKFFYMIFAATMMLTIFTGCQKQSNNTNTNTNASAKEDTEDTNASSDQNNNQEVISVDHSMGTVSIPSDVKKVVIFDFGILDMIDSLGIDVELALPVDSLPAYLEHYGDVTNAGGIKEPNLEAIFEFEPDVIFIGSRQQDYYEQLAEIAPTIYVELNGDSYMEDFSSNLGYVAEVFGKQQETEEILNTINQKIEEVKELTSKSEEKALILLTNDGALSVYGKGSRFGIIHDVLGVKAADEAIEASTHGQTANFEYISEINPDILFVVDRTVVVGGSNTANTVLDNDLVNETNAAKNGKIIALDPDIWYLSGGGIASITEMIEDIREAYQAQ